MIKIKQRIADRLAALRDDYGRIGFWTVYALLMPIFGLAALSAVIIKSGPWIKASPWGLLVFTVSVGVLCGFAVLTTNIISIVAGWAFGFWIGVFAMMVGIAIAITINFYFSRKLAGEKFDQILEERPKINAIHKELLAGHTRKVFVIIALLRLSVTPFAATNYLISASGVPFPVYFFSTMVGYIPRTAAAVFVGTTLEYLTFEQPRESWMVLLSLAATITMVIVISVLSKRALNRLTESVLDEFAVTES